MGPTQCTNNHIYGSYPMHKQYNLENKSIPPFSPFSLLSPFPLLLYDNDEDYCLTVCRQHGDDNARQHASTTEMRLLNIWQPRGTFYTRRKSFYTRRKSFIQGGKSFIQGMKSLVAVHNEKTSAVEPSV